MPKKRIPAAKPRGPLTPASFRRMISQQVALIKTRPRTAQEAHDQLRAYYQISRMVNQHLSGRATYGDNQFIALAQAIGHTYTWLYEVRFFAQRYSLQDLKELCSYDPPLCWGHVRLLFPVHDKRRRRKLQRLAAEEGWPTERLRSEIRARLGPGRHRGRGMAGLDHPEACLRKLNQLTSKWNRFAQAAMERGSGPLAEEDIDGSVDCQTLLAEAQAAVEQLKTISGQLQRRLRKLAPQSRQR